VQRFDLAERAKKEAAVKIVLAVVGILLLVAGLV
jgi:hypothetical protein